ncbi:hypothetical protein B0J14DRAFT_489444 [Halenospora varia]|nr:hypothetical protein B0J14DRAFT_489444 [Halenospora varia]
MPEIIHHSPTSSTPPPEPAKPITADQLLLLEIAQRKRFSRNGKSERIGLGCEGLDELFSLHEKRGNDGIERGLVVGISAEGGRGERGEGVLISLHALASILIPHLSSAKPVPNGKINATIIDTTGSIPLPLLAKILKSRILESRSASSLRNVTTANYQLAQNEKVEEEDVDEEVVRCLEMVTISRVFNIEGLWEVLGEIGRETHTPTAEARIPQQQFEGSSPPWPTQDSSPEKTPQILDSEDDEELELSPVKAPRKKAEMQKEDEGVEMIIVDNMTHIINELFGRREKNEAHALLTSLSRTLHTLTNSQNLLTILHNTTTSASFSNTYAQSKSAPQATKSVFEANPIKPSLGVIFSQFVELHVLVSKMPRGRRDAEILSGQTDDVGGNEEVNYCYVAEILKDETPNLPLLLPLPFTSLPATTNNKTLLAFGGREHKWIPLNLILDPVSGEATGLKNCFTEKGNMRGMGLERRGVGRGFEGNIGMGRQVDMEIETGGAVESRVGSRVGNVAKIHGFGGRRV